MHAVPFRRQYVYLYASSLFTTSPLLKRIYCESHRFEPWAVHGRRVRYGHYRYPNVLYVEQSERDRLLEDVPDLLLRDASYVATLRRRYRSCLRQVVRRWHRSDPLRLVFDTARYLSVGLFKEAFEPPQAEAFLSDFMPTAGLTDTILALYQPRALPHFLKYELKRHTYAARRDVNGFIDRAVHHSRFLLEEGPLHDPAAAQSALDELWDEFGSAAAILARRGDLLQQHAAAVHRARQAEHTLLAAMHAFARYSLDTHRAVHQALDLIAFIATTEELKHILTVQSARVLRTALESAGLPLETTDLEALVEQYGPDQTGRVWGDDEP